MNKVKSEDPATYVAGTKPARDTVREKEDKVIEHALTILSSRLAQPGVCIDTPDKTRQYLSLQLSQKEHEVFCCLFLDNRHRVIGFGELFQGTIDGASVHPREVVKEALKRNAAAVIFSHNHPSGVSEPSRADIQLTRRLSDALALIDVRVLDHIVVGAGETTSFAERGLI